MAVIRNKLLYTNQFASVSKLHPDSVMDPFVGTLKEATLQSSNHLLASYAGADSIKFKIFNSAELLYDTTSIFKDGIQEDSAEVLVRVLRESFDENSATWNTAPSAHNEFALSAVHKYTEGYIPIPITDNWKDIFQYGVEISMPEDSPYKIYFNDPASSDSNYESFCLRVAYSDAVAGYDILATAPNGGYLAKDEDAKFTWATRKQRCIGDIWKTKTVFRWCESAIETDAPPADAIIHEIQLVAEESISIPANTFSQDFIWWQVEITTNSGAVTVSDWAWIATKEKTAPPTPLSPIDTIVNGSQPFLIKWAHYSAYGTPQASFELQYSADGTTWDRIFAADTSDQSYIVPAGTFAVGSYWWRVRTYSIDWQVSEYSTAVKFVVEGAPATPGISIANASPHWAIAWTQNGQQAYRIELDGEIITQSFGTISSYQYPEWTDDGTHIVRVQIQNKYGLWSEWGQALLQISNVSGPAIVLMASISSSLHAVDLSWSGGSERYIIYRDNKIVGRTSRTQFVDRFSIGNCIYKVRGISGVDGNYSISDPVEISYIPKNLELFDIPHKVLIDLHLSEVQSRTIDEAVTQAAEYLHFAGSKKPSVEFGESVDRSISFNCAFANADEKSIANFEAAIGGTVCVKLPDGASIIGALTAYEKKHTEFYTAYQSSVIETEFNEEAFND